MRISVLNYLFGSASLMWLVDAVVEYCRHGSECFYPSPEKMLNDLFLGFAVVVLALIVWIVVLFVSDPLGVFRK